jgi:hypothetical protein
LCESDLHERIVQSWVAEQCRMVRDSRIDGAEDGPQAVGHIAGSGKAKWREDAGEKRYTHMRPHHQKCAEADSRKLL